MRLTSLLCLLCLSLAPAGAARRAGGGPALPPAGPGLRAGGGGGPGAPGPPQRRGGPAGHSDNRRRRLAAIPFLPAGAYPAAPAPLPRPGATRTLTGTWATDYAGGEPSWVYLHPGGRAFWEWGGSWYVGRWEPTGPAAGVVRSQRFEDEGAGPSPRGAVFEDALVVAGAGAPAAGWQLRPPPAGAKPPRAPAALWGVGIDHPRHRQED